MTLAYQMANCILYPTLKAQTSLFSKSAAYLPSAASQPDADGSYSMPWRALPSTWF